MKNFETEQLKDFIWNNLNEIMMYPNKDGKFTSYSDRYHSVRSAFLNSIPKEIIDEINTKDEGFIPYIVPELTIEVTTKKKGKVIMADHYNLHLKNTIIELPKKYHDLLFYKQILFGRNFKEYGFFIDNTKPKHICCDGMKQQFTFCEHHGLNCPDYFLKCNVNGEIRIDADNASYAISNCPFCGAKLNNEEKQRKGRVLAAIDIPD